MNADLILDLLDQGTLGAAPQCRPVPCIAGGDQQRIWGRSAHDRCDLSAEIIHVKGRIVLSADGQRVFFVPAAHSRIRPIFFRIAATPRRYASNCTSGQESALSPVVNPVFSASMPIKLVLPLVSPCQLPA